MGKTSLVHYIGSWIVFLLLFLHSLIHSLSFQYSNTVPEDITLKEGFDFVPGIFGMHGDGPKSGDWMDFEGIYKYPFISIHYYFSLYY